MDNLSNEKEKKYENLENDFFKDLDDTQRCILLLGMKGSGKTHLMLKYLLYALSNDFYEKIHCVFPCFKHERDGAYDFLRNQKQVLIYPTYTDKVSQRVEKDRDAGYKTLFMIDDCSGMKLNDEKMNTIITTARHGKSKKHEHGGICVWMAMHAARKIISPIIRGNVDYIFLFKMNNRKLLESLYEEYFSMRYNKFKEFLAIYQKVVSVEHNAILYSNQSNYYDIFIADWNIHNLETQLRPREGPKEKEKEKEKEKVIKEKKENKNTLKFSRISFSKYK